MSDRLLKESDVIEAFKGRESLIHGVYTATAIIRSVPSADRPQGEWILSDLQSQADNDNGNYSYVCTNCNHADIHTKTQKVPYCWWCGARMKGADDD